VISSFFHQTSYHQGMAVPRKTTAAMPVRSYRQLSNATALRPSGIPFHTRTASHRLKISEDNRAEGSSTLEMTNPKFLL
jgi:hypothetical protein